MITDSRSASHSPSPNNRRRTIVIGASCFLLASVLVQADVTNVPGTLPPGHIHAISDGSNQAQTAKVNTAGELSAVDSGARARLDQVAAKVGALDAKVPTLAADADGLRVSATGHVTVDNQPTAMAIAGGTIAVGNFPPVQAVTGAVTIANMPATQNVNVVGGTSLGETSGGFGGGRFKLMNDGLTENAYLASLEANVVLPSPRFLQLFPRGQEHLVTLLSLNSDRDVHLTCRYRGVPLFTMANSSMNQRQEFVHPLRVDECYIACLHQTPEPLPPLWPQCNGTYSIAGLGPSTYTPPPVITNTAQMTPAEARCISNPEPQCF